MHRTAVGRDFSLIKDRGCFGGEGHARLPIRGVDNHRLRFLCTLIPLAVLALSELGVELPAELADTGGPKAGLSKAQRRLNGP